MGEAAGRPSDEVARQKEALMAASAEIHMALEELQGYAPSPCSARAAVQGLGRAADILEAEILAASPKRSRPALGVDR